MKVGAHKKVTVEITLTFTPIEIHNLYNSVCNMIPTTMGGSAARSQLEDLKSGLYAVINQIEN